jgi:hypothetical protein
MFFYVLHQNKLEELSKMDSYLINNFIEIDLDCIGKNIIWGQMWILIRNNNNNNNKISQQFNTIKILKLELKIYKKDFKILI